MSVPASSESSSTDPFEGIGPHEPTRLAVEGVRTVGDVLRRRVELTPDAPASFEKDAGGRWRRLSWQELYDRCLRAAAGLVELGLGTRDRIAILGPTTVGWTVYDLGGLLAGVTTMGIYPKQSPEQVRYLLEHSETRVVFVAGAEELEVVLEAADGLESLESIVPWSDELLARCEGRDPRLVSPGRFRGDPLSEKGAADEVAARQESLDADSTAILIYTSGTTGPPKGAKISHGNIVSLLRGYDDVMTFYRDDLLFSFLPMAHATERVLAFYGRIATGVASAYASSIGAVIEELPEVRPTVFGSVPRIFEKLYARIQGEVAKAPAPRRAIFRWAEDVGRRRIRHVLATPTPDPSRVPLGLRLQHAVAERLVFRKIRAALGGRVRACITGAAPISHEILEFLWAVDLPVLEAYGMTEATVVTHMSRLDQVRLGTVGKVLPTMECRIAADGEILVRGPMVFQGYLKNPRVTAETVVDGWLHTGDVGEVDEEGFLRITDRKKHLIITAGGKNVAPANIERAIKMQSPRISQVHAHGDRRPYVSALIAPSPVETLDWGLEHGLLDAEEVEARRRELQADPAARSEALARSMAKVVADRRFRELFREAVRRGNRELARVERVRRYFVLDRDLSQEGGEMTPTLKMKRKAIEEKYAAEFDRLYAAEFDRLYEDEDFGIEAEAPG